MHDTCNTNVAVDDEDAVCTVIPQVLQQPERMSDLLIFPTSLDTGGVKMLRNTPSKQPMPPSMMILQVASYSS